MFHSTLKIVFGKLTTNMMSVSGIFHTIQIDLSQSIVGKQSNEKEEEKQSLERTMMMMMMMMMMMIKISVQFVAQLLAI
jgi:hypothetical protein